MGNIGVGVVGCGFVGRGAHVPAFAEMQGAELVAVADPDAKRRGKVEKKYPLQSSYEDYRQLIDDPAVQLVVVATPTPLHAQVALAAVEAGKHVLCEMPLAVSLAEADRLIDAARRQGVVLMPSLTYRFTPSFVKLKQMIGQGAIGRPVSLTYRELIPAADLAGQWPAGSWMWDVDKSGGPLFTLAVWSIDLMRWIVDSDIEQVHANARYSRLEKYETLGYDASVTLAMASGQVGCLQYSGSVAHCAAECQLQVIGDSTGVLCTSNHDSVSLLGDEPAKTQWNVGQHGARMWGHFQQNEHLVRCIRDRRQPDVTPEDGRKAMEIAARISRAR